MRVSITRLPALLPELRVCTDQKRVSLIQGLGELSRSQWLCVAYKFENRISLLPLGWKDIQSVSKSPFNSETIRTSCSTFKAASSPEDRHTFYKHQPPSLRKGPRQPSCWVAALLEWLLLFKSAKGRCSGYYQQGQEGTGR